MRDLESLVKKFEQATEGSRELDALIEVAVGSTNFGTLANGYRWELEAHPDGVSVNLNATDGKHSSRQKRYTPPLYTTSLDDAALTLVPEGESWGCGYESSNLHGMAWVGANNRTCTAATPALALCIASLRALQSGENNDGK